MFSVLAPQETRTLNKWDERELVRQALLVSFFRPNMFRCPGLIKSSQSRMHRESLAVLSLRTDRYSQSESPNTLPWHYGSNEEQSKLMAHSFTIYDRCNRSSGAWLARKTGGQIISSTRVSWDIVAVVRVLTWTARRLATTLCPKWTML